MNEILSPTLEETLRIAREIDRSDLPGKMTGAQIRMARAALGWTVADLARASGVSPASIQRAENTAGIPAMMASNLFKVMRALEMGGVIFIDPDETAGEGVRLRRRRP